MNPNNHPREIESLTILRFFAAILVVFHHAPFLMLSARKAGHAHLSHFFHNGYMGVTLFFVLSGFVLFYSSLRKRESNRYTVYSFFSARIARVVPLVYFLSVPYLIKDVADGSVDHWKFYLFAQAWSSDIAVAFSNLAVAWSLSVEMFLYLCFPLIFFLVHRSPFSRLRTGLLLLLGGALIPLAGSLYFEFLYEGPTERGTPFGPYHVLYHLPLTRLGDFLIGIGLALVYFSADEWKHRTRIGQGALAAGVLGLTVTLSLVSTQSHWSWDTIWLPSVSAIILGGALIETSITKRGAIWQGLLQLGRASFALYLIHQAYILKNFVPKTEGPAKQMLKVFGLIWALSIAVLLAMALHRHIEEPAQAFVSKKAKQLRNLFTR